MPLSEEIKNKIQLSYSEWLDNNKCKPRYAQRQMIAHIARRLGGVEIDSESLRESSCNQHLAVVQAGTGTGKTLAYLIASLVIAQSLEKKLVVSTATVALQEQLLLKDLPSLLENTSLDFKYAMAKGRSRYLCLAKLAIRLQQLTGMEAGGLFPDEVDALSRQRCKLGWRCR